MARKKTTDVQSNGANGHAAAVAEPAAQPIEPRPEPELQQPSPAPADDRRKPLVSYRVNSDRTTSVSLAVWANQMTNTQTNEAYEQLSVTVQRRFRNDQGEWAAGGSWRVHDLPVLMFLLMKAHAFCLDRRTSDSTVPF